MYFTILYLAIGSVTGKDFTETPGLHRTLLGDGLAVSLLAGLFGGPHRPHRNPQEKQRDSLYGGADA